MNCRVGPNKQLLTRAIAAVLLNGPADQMQATIGRAQHIMEYLLIIPGWTPVVLTESYTVDLSTEETRAVSIVDLLAFLPPADAHQSYKEWLGNIHHNLARTSTGSANTTPLVLNNRELQGFVADYCRDIQAAAEVTGNTRNLDYLVTTVTEILSKWTPLNLPDDGDNTRVKLMDLIYVGADHYEGGLAGYLQTLQTRQTENWGGVAADCRGVGGNNVHNPYNVDRLFYAIKISLAQKFYSEGTILNGMYFGFPRGDYYDAEGLPSTIIIDEVDAVEAVVQEGGNRVLNLLRQYYGEDWEVTANRWAGHPTPVPAVLEDLWLDSTDIYGTTYKGANYHIRKWDPASRICDQAVTSTGRLRHRVLCLLPDHLRLPQMHRIAINFLGEVKVSDVKEIPWPGWPSRVRRTGYFLQTQSVKPEDERAIPITHWPEAWDETDLLFAPGDTHPVCFNAGRLPKNKVVYNLTQHVGNPHNIADHEHMHSVDKFVAGGPLTTIPISRNQPGVEMSLRRCQLCRWVYGRVVYSTTCEHTICTVCLGVTSLIR